MQCIAKAKIHNSARDPFGRYVSLRLQTSLRERYINSVVQHDSKEVAIEACLFPWT